MNFIRSRLAELGNDAVSRDEAADLRQEQRELMMVTQESPSVCTTAWSKTRRHFDEYEATKRQLSSGNLAVGRFDRQEVSKSRPVILGFDPGRQHRLDACGRQV